MPVRPFTVPAALLAVVGLALFGLPSFSGATFTATSGGGATVAAAEDWTPPTVAVRDPGATVQGTVTVTADASDSRSGIAGVTLQRLAPGSSTWVDLCTRTATPYSCSWDTSKVEDGNHALRAVATDRAGYTTTSETVRTVVANSITVVLADPGDVVRGTVTLTATLHNNLLPYAVRFEYAVSGSTGWKTICTSALSSTNHSCTWTTTGSAYTQGESYDLRAVAVAGLFVSSSAVVADVMVDNVAPTVTMVDPGSPLRGTATFAANAADADAGIAEVRLQHQRAGASTWTTFCTLTTEPFGCRYATAQLADGTYAFRAVAVDAIGNTTTSATVGNRVVDNTVSSVAVEDPGAFLNGAVTVTATAASSAGVASVRIDRAAAGTTSWTTLCTDATAPYECAWDTTTVANGAYDLRAVLVDAAGRTTTSATLTGRRVDNSVLRAYDVQAVNGGATVGRLEAGDVLRLTYTDRVNPASVLAGWNGNPTAVTLRLRDAMNVGSSGNNDTLDVQNAPSLGAVNLRQNFAKNNRTVTYGGTMVASTTTVDGRTATVITITLGAPSNTSWLRTAGATSTMVWTPAPGVTDLEGRASSTAPATERGALDKEF